MCLKKKKFGTGRGKNGVYQAEWGRGISNGAEEGVYQTGRRRGIPNGIGAKTVDVYVFASIFLE